MRDTARWCFLERGSVLSAFGSSVEAGRDEQRGAEKVKSLPILLARIRVASLPSPPSHCCRCTTVNRPKNNNKTVMTSLILYIYIYIFPPVQDDGAATSMRVYEFIIYFIHPPPLPRLNPIIRRAKHQSLTIPSVQAVLSEIRQGKGNKVAFKPELVTESCTRHYSLGV